MLDSATFKAICPEFSSSSYDARITALLGMLPDLDADRLGNQLNLALAYWVAGKLARQDKTIKFGAAAMSSGSSTSTEKMVGQASIKTSLSQSQSSGMAHAAFNEYEQMYENLIRQYGFGAVAV